MFYSPQGIFFTGIVEDRNDPERVGRVRVRVHGLHTYDKTALPTEDLPWAMTSQSITSAGISGVGESPTGIVEGACVLVIFMDGDSYQVPVVLGTFAGIPTERPNTQLGLYDPNGVYPEERFLNKSDVPPTARNDDGTDPETVEEDKATIEEKVWAGLKDTWNEPESAFAAEYPKNQVKRTESGHLVEYDDTPGKERINVRHRTGTRTEYYPDGSLVKKVKENNYEIIYGNDYIYIKGHASITVDGPCQILCKSDAELAIDGNLNFKVKGNLQHSVDGDAVMAVTGNFYIHSDSDLILSADNIHENSPGLVTPNDLAPELNMTALDAGTQNDDPETDSGMSESEYQDLQTRSGVAYSGEILSTDNTPAPEEDIEGEIPQECSDIPADWTYSTRLSSRYSIGSVSRNAVFPHDIIAQGGLSELQIICNLKGVIENILEPLANKYGTSKIQINSGFRAGSGSQHNRGQALDLYFRNVSYQGHMEIMQWIRDNLPFDQVILERGKNPWIHVSYSYSSKRKQVLTRTAPGVYKSGILNVG